MSSGSSTISQQTAKNVFTFGSPTLVRKVVEAYWTVLIEFIWGKRRILEVYLNVAEMGRGIFGAEAAAKHYFGVPARRMDRKQAASIAVCLPRPLVSNPDRMDKESKARLKRIMSDPGEYPLSYLFSSSADLMYLARSSSETW